MIDEWFKMPEPIKAFPRLMALVDKLTAPQMLLRKASEAKTSTPYMKNLLGWLETRLAQNTLNHLKIA